MKLRYGILAKARKSSAGQTFTEYSLVLLLVGVAAFSAYAGLGVGVKAVTGNILTFVEAVAAAL